MRRRQHIINTAKSDAIPSQIVCVEIECRTESAAESPRQATDALVGWHGIGLARVGDCWRSPVVISGSSACQFWEALLPRLKKGGTAWVFGTELCQSLTLLGLWASLESGLLSLSTIDHRDGNRTTTPGSSRRSALAILEDPPTILDVRAPWLSGTLRFVDVANYGATSLASIAPASERAARCGAFVMAMIAALQEYKLGALQCTAGSQSMVAWRRSMMTQTVLVHENALATGIEDSAYYGGRCEAFRLGSLPDRVWHLDVSAMYPYCYGAADLPVCLLGAADNVSVSDIELLASDHGVIADVRITTQQPCYPYRDVRNRLTVWPVGSFRTSICGPELSDALNLGIVSGCYRAAWYAMAPALQEYSRRMRLMRAKLAGDVCALQWAKALAVCIVGKMGQRSRRWIDDASTLPHGPWSQWYQGGLEAPAVRWRSIAGHEQREEVDGFSWDACPAMAGWITSLARMRLLAIIRCAGWANVYYCDTDSVMVGEAGFSALAAAGWIADGEWGKLRVKRYSDRVSIGGIKSYVEDGVSTDAGKSKRAGRATGSDGAVWVKPHPQSSFRTGIAPQAVRHQITFSRDGRYRHGVRNEDGTVSPFWLRED